MSIAKRINELKAELPEGVKLVAVSKTHPAEVVMEAYEAGQRVFGENRPQELRAKYEVMPKDIKWHQIGQLQTNKVKYIAPFVVMIESVDSDKLLTVIDKEARKNERIIDVLFEVHVAEEESKSGWTTDELTDYIASGKWREYANVRVRGLMAIATFTDDIDVIKSEFRAMKSLFDKSRPAFGEHFDTLSMGMTSDYVTAIECGSTEVRIGSLIFGAR